MLQGSFATPSASLPFNWGRAVGAVLVSRRAEAGGSETRKLAVAVGRVIARMLA